MKETGFVIYKNSARAVMDVTVYNCPFFALPGGKRMGKIKENKIKNRKKPVKVIVKPVYVGKQDMAEVFGSVALENIRRKMQED